MSLPSPSRRPPRPSPRLRRLLRGLRHGLAVAPLLGAALLPGTAQAGVNSLSRLYVFGDSLSDSGNSKKISNDAVGATFPPAPYFDGRFSNGLVAAEYLWQAFNPGDSSFRASLAGGTNYAVGGATTGVENFVQVWSVTPGPLKPAYADKGNAWQLDQFSTPAPPSFDPETSLFLVWLFPNDPFYFLNSPGQGVGTFDGTGGGPSTLGALVPNAVSNILGTIQELAGYGARNFLVPNSPDLGLIPEFINDSGQRAFFSGLSALFNAQLEAGLNGLAVSQPNLDIEAFQTDDLFAAVRANPAAYGFTNVSDRCLINPQTQPCSTPENYLFWDGSHPTTTGHKLIGQSFYQAVYEPVPGPLPAAGAAAGLAWSRRLRRRLRLRPRRTSRSCGGRCPAG